MPSDDTDSGPALSLRDRMRQLRERYIMPIKYKPNHSGSPLKDHLWMLRDQYIGIIAVLEFTQLMVDLAETKMDETEIWIEKISDIGTGKIADDLDLLHVFCDGFIGAGAEQDMATADGAIGTAKRSIEGLLADLHSFLHDADEAEVARRIRERVRGPTMR